MSYVPLWCKSNFSFLEGASHPDELVERAHALGLPALALTDRDGVHGVVRAHVKARELGVSLIVGAEVTVGGGDPADAEVTVCDAGPAGAEATVGGGAPADAEVTVRRGFRRRRVPPSVTMAPPAPAPGRLPARRRPPPPACCSP